MVHDMWWPNREHIVARRKTVKLWVVGVLLCAMGVLSSTGLVSAQDYVVDQESSDFTHVLDYGIFSHDPIGQEFVPTLDHVDIVEVVTSSSGGTQLQVLIRDDTIDGEILGSSSKLVEPGYNNVERFEFDESVPLVPFGRYVIEVRQLSGTGGLSVRGEDNYPNGRLIVSGEAWDAWDTWFREGVRTPVPVESTSWGAIKALFK